VQPPFQAAALILTILIVQDAISIWVYRSNWGGPPPISLALIWQGETGMWRGKL
jgi:hypothetical protein